MPGLVPAIHVLNDETVKTWMPGTSPGMTEVRQNGSQDSRHFRAARKRRGGRSAGLWTEDRVSRSSSDRRRHSQVLSRYEKRRPSRRGRLGYRMDSPDNTLHDPS